MSERTVRRLPAAATRVRRLATSRAAASAGIWPADLRAWPRRVLAIVTTASLLATAGAFLGPRAMASVAAGTITTVASAEPTSMATGGPSNDTLYALGLAPAVNGVTQVSMYDLTTNPPTGPTTESCADCSVFGPALAADEAGNLYWFGNGGVWERTASTGVDTLLFSAPACQTTSPYCPAAFASSADSSGGAISVLPDGSKAFFTDGDNVYEILGLNSASPPTMNYLSGNNTTPVPNPAPTSSIAQSEGIYNATGIVGTTTDVFVALQGAKEVVDIDLAHSGIDGSGHFVSPEKVIAGNVTTVTADDNQPALSGIGYTLGLALDGADQVYFGQYNQGKVLRISDGGNPSSDCPYDSTVSPPCTLGLVVGGGSSTADNVTATSESMSNGANMLAVGGDGALYADSGSGIKRVEDIQGAPIDGTLPTAPGAVAALPSGPGNDYPASTSLIPDQSVYVSWAPPAGLFTPTTYTVTLQPQPSGTPIPEQVAASDGCVEGVCSTTVGSLTDGTAYLVTAQYQDGTVWSSPGQAAAVTPEPQSTEPVTVTGPSPSSGSDAGNYEVDIQGTGFTASSNSVLEVVWGHASDGSEEVINQPCAGALAQGCFIVASDTEIQLEAPPMSATSATDGTAFPILVVTANGGAGSNPPTPDSPAVGGGGFTYTATPPPSSGPTVSGVVSNSTSPGGGYQVDIQGSGFGTPSAVAPLGKVLEVVWGQLAGSGGEFVINQACGTQLSFDCLIVAGDGDIQLQAPPMSGTAAAPNTPFPVLVVTSDGQATSSFTYTEGAPVVYGVSPNVGLGADGVGVTVTGANFYGATQVSFDTTPADILSNDGSNIEVVPPAQSGAVDVTVTTPVGTSTTTGVDGAGTAASPNDVYWYQAPVPAPGGSGTPLAVLSADALAANGPQSVTLSDGSQVTVGLGSGSLPFGASLSLYQVDPSAAQSDLPSNETVVGGLGVSLSGATNTSVTDPVIVQLQAPPGLLPTELGGGASPALRSRVATPRNSGSGASYRAVADAYLDGDPAFDGCPGPISTAGNQVDQFSMTIDPSSAWVSGYSGANGVGGGCRQVVVPSGVTIYQHPNYLGVDRFGYINLAARGISSTTPIQFFPDGIGGFRIAYGTAGYNLELADPSSSTLASLVSGGGLDANTDLYSGGPAGIIAVGSGSIIAVGSGSIIAVGSGSLLSNNNNGIIAVGSGSLLGTASSGLASVMNSVSGGSLAVGAGGIGSGPQGSGIIAVGSGSIIAVGSGSIIAVGSGSLRFRALAARVGEPSLLAHDSSDVTYSVMMWQDPTFVLASGPPSAPMGVAAQPGVASASVSWNPPALDGGSAVTSYTLMAHPHGVSGTASDVTTTLAASSLTPASDGTYSAILPGLSPGTTYDVTAAATNAKGTGPSSTSASVVPLALSYGAGAGLGGGSSPSPGTTPAPPPPGTSSSDTTALGTTTVTPTGAGLSGGTGSGVSASVSVPAGALPTGTTVTEYAIDTSAFSPPSGSNFVVGFGVSWTGSPTTQTAANGKPIPVTMTIQDPSITAGQTIYVVGPSGSLVALSPGSYSIDPGSHTLTISFTQDPAFLVAAPGSGTSPASQLGYRLVGSDGGVFDFGSASFHGSASGYPIPAPIAGMAATPDGAGYWLVGRDGTVYPYGDARFLGQTSGDHLAAPIVGMAATPDGAGYWLVGQDGGVFSFGDAAFRGSTGALHLAAPIVGMAATPDGAGYWLVGQDGGVFSFGDAAFRGSTGALHLAAPIVGMAATPDGAGYWLVGQDGGVFSFGDAAFMGSTGGRHLGGPVVAVAGPAGFQTPRTKSNSRPRTKSNSRPRTKSNSLDARLARFLRVLGGWLW